MKVHYHKAWGLSFVIMASVLIVAHLYLASLTGQVKILNMITAIIILIAGIAYLTRPYFELEGNEIRLLAPLGYVVRVYRFNSTSEIVWIGNKMYLDQNGYRKRIRITKWMCNVEDFDKFVAKLKGEDDSLLKELHDVK